MRLARWLRDQRSNTGCSYAELAARVGLHATALQRAASGQSVPSERSVRAYAIACDAPVDTAMDLWRQARRGRLRSAGPAPARPQDIDGVEMLRATLRELYEVAGRPSVRVMEMRAGTGRLPHSTAHRIVLGQTVPRDAHQLTGFLTACLVGAVGAYPNEREVRVGARPGGGVRHIQHVAVEETGDAGTVRGPGEPARGAPAANPAGFSSK
ncbi:helix-turn-helix domain-containing protein [Streptomyces anthocyanicus]|uniref:helix-turn-helix domain-containing protein n=1 Tax=Streptomyces anthocyanicus TaxID=68174 RepID=UPI00369A4325